MALSDELSKLAARAREAEQRVAAATSEARAQLEQDVKGAREAAQAARGEASASFASPPIAVSR